MARQSFEIAPREKKYGFLLVVCLAFTALLMYRLHLGQPIRNTVFLLPLALFTMMLIIKRLADPKTISLTVTPEGMELHYNQGRVRISWLDVEAVGASSYAAIDIIGIRLKSYDRYLEACLLP